MLFTSGPDRAFERLMQEKPGFDHYDGGGADAPEDCGTCRFYRPDWKYQFCQFAECPYQPGKLTDYAAVKFTVKGANNAMAVFRVEKNKGYTVMSNHHLRNKNLTLKAKGLLSQMLSLPEDWDYTLKGLSYINRESIDAIRTAVWELEKAGYIRREQGRDAKGKMADMVYTIYEQPVLENPVLENPTSDNPVLENPTSDNPASENPTQLNKEVQRTDLSKKEKIITDGQSTHSIPIPSPTPAPMEGEAAATPPERKRTGKDEAVRIYREIILENIEYAYLIQDRSIDREQLDEIVDLMLETVCTARKTIRVAGDDIYRRVKWNNRGCKSTVWRCVSRVLKGKMDFDCPARTVKEEVLHGAIVTAVNDAYARRNAVISLLKTNIQETVFDDLEAKIAAIDEQLAELQQQMIDNSGNHELVEELADQIDDLRGDRQDILAEAAERTDLQARMNDMIAFLEEMPAAVTEYSESLTRRLVERITIFDEKIVVELKSGLTMEVEE